MASYSINSPSNFLLIILQLKKLNNSSHEKKQIHIPLTPIYTQVFMSFLHPYCLHIFKLFYLHTHLTFVIPKNGCSDFPQPTIKPHGSLYSKSQSFKNVGYSEHTSTKRIDEHRYGVNR